MEQLTLPAPAKLNLFLNILSRRSDGYHELQTVFQLLDFCDMVELTLTARDITVTCEGMEIAAQENLVFKAASRLRAESAVSAGVHIHLRKEIPAGAGLGGGSSDAATTLLGLNWLWRLALPESRLLSLGAELGADVPVFLKGRSAWAEGIGEKLQPVDLPRKWYLVIYPGCSVSTSTVFNHPDLTRHGTPITIARFLEQGSAPNVCEPVVRSLYPAVDEACRWLSQWGPARMTGSGSCVFLGLDTEHEARKVCARVPEGWTGIAAAGVSESPLMGALARVGISS